jgi:hypothetical protein
MAMAQDSSHPTGVSSDNGGDSALTRARQRKANAALQLVMNDGATWVQVAEVIGFPTPRAAKVAVEQALEQQLVLSDREHLRAFVAARYDRLLKATWSNALDEDSPDQLAAVRETRATLADLVKLWGLAAPAEVVISSPSEREIELWVASVTAQSTPQLEESDIFEDGEVIDGEVLSDTGEV